MDAAHSHGNAKGIKVACGKNIHGTERCMQKNLFSCCHIFEIPQLEDSDLECLDLSDIARAEDGPRPRQHGCCRMR